MLAVLAEHGVLLQSAQGPVPNVAKTPVVGGQWRTGTDFPFDLTIVSNKQAPNIPVAGEVQPLGAAVAR